ncbi:hypothetical protein ACFXKW_33300 [Streptomyces sp. NPDC059193]|uniref:hypothetical protein n=1 Tax=Streptomyces sp. NPDC059193 TaxID=3346763 RepID=UPI0036AAAD47
MSRTSLWRQLFGGGEPGAAAAAAPGAEPLTLARVTEPLAENMSAIDGDFSMEGIQRLGNPVPMLVENSGDELLELWLEPFGQDYWLRPGEQFTVTSYGTWHDRPFELAHDPGQIRIWACSCFATVTFPDGTEVPGGHQRPAGKYGTQGTQAR